MPSKTKANQEIVKDNWGNRGTGYRRREQFSWSNEVYSALRRSNPCKEAACEVVLFTAVTDNALAQHSYASQFFLKPDRIWIINYFFSVSHQLILLACTLFLNTRPWNLSDIYYNVSQIHHFLKKLFVWVFFFSFPPGDDFCSGWSRSMKCWKEKAERNMPLQITLFH